MTLRTDIMPFQAGSTTLIQADDWARTLLLYGAGDVLESIPIRLRAGELNELHL